MIKFDRVHLLLFIGLFLQLIFILNIVFLRSNYNNFTISDNFYCKDLLTCHDIAMKFQTEGNYFNSFNYLFYGMKYYDNNKIIESGGTGGIRYDSRYLNSQLSHYRNEIYDIDGSIFFLNKINNKSCDNIKVGTYYYYQKGKYNLGLDLLENNNEKVDKCSLYYLKGLLYYGGKDYQKSLYRFIKSKNVVNTYSNPKCSEFLLDTVINFLKIKITNPNDNSKIKIKSPPNPCEPDMNPFDYNNKPFYKDQIFERIITYSN